MRISARVIAAAVLPFVLVAGTAACHRDTATAALSPGHTMEITVDFSRAAKGEI